ncbi:hypothetical protein L6452_20689 [Arctium lappa]|uniref:Uncharacterized protein n=1 Tax=Arctium lappa TaxID=4217 RepID=A0ACB9BCY1_ARCLA|nr:hypothetical protein L6452_20689 [Arctium lappa]
MACSSIVLYFQGMWFSDFVVFYNSVFVVFYNSSVGDCFSEKGWSFYDMNISGNLGSTNIITQVMFTRF